MKASVLTGLTATALLAVVAMPPHINAQESPAAQEEKSEHARYKILDLGPVGGPPGAPSDITNNGLVAGAAATREGAMHAVLWFNRVKIDIGKPGLGRPNSAALGINHTGQVVGKAETPVANYEDFCGFNAYGLPHSDSACLPFLWQDGIMNPLPTLGGANGAAYMINDHGVAVGLAETNMQEGACPVSQFKPVVWKDGAAYPLPTFKGDPVGVAAWINDKGQVVVVVGKRQGDGPRQPRRDRRHRGESLLRHQQPRSGGWTFGAAKRHHLPRLSMDEGERYAGPANAPGRLCEPWPRH